MKIEYRDIRSITPYSNNPRLNEGAVDAVVRSLTEFGWQQPIVVDEGGVVIAGHTRLMAAEKIGYSTVPVLVATGLSPEKVKAYRLADNRSAEIAEWDMEKLLMELSDLTEAGYDATAWFEAELADLACPETEGATDGDAVPDAPEEPVSDLGGVYTLGRHRLVVGDATHLPTVEKLMGGAEAQLLLTDPPYNVAYEGKTSDALTIQNDQMEDESFRRFLAAAFSAANSVMASGAGFYIWHADSEGFNFRGACRDSGWRVRQCLIWNKNSMVLGRQDYHWRHEPVLYGWKDGAAHHWYSDRKQTTVLDFDRPCRSESHPTMKPVKLFEYLMQNSSRRGDVVLDLFAGSGTTAIAAERTGRTAYLLELDPVYADVIRKRWAQFVHGASCDWQELTPCATY